MNLLQKETCGSTNNNNSIDNTEHAVSPSTDGLAGLSTGTRSLSSTGSFLSSHGFVKSANQLLIKFYNLGHGSRTYSVFPANDACVNRSFLSRKICLRHTFQAGISVAIFRWAGVDV